MAELVGPNTKYCPSGSGAVVAFAAAFVAVCSTAATGTSLAGLEQPSKKQKLSGRMAGRTFIIFISCFHRYMRQMDAKSARIVFEKPPPVSHFLCMNLRSCVVANLGGVALIFVGCDKPGPRAQVAPPNPPPPANAEAGFSPTNA